MTRTPESTPTRSRMPNRRAAAALLVAGACALAAACGSDADVDTSDIPLFRPAALTAKDGTQIPLPAQVADTGTPSQRDRYAAQVLVPTRLSVHVPAAAQACALLNGGMPSPEAVAKIAAQEKVDTKDAQRIVFAGALSWCPKFRGPFDALAAATKSGAPSSTTTPSKSKSGSSGSSDSSGSDGSSTDSSTGSSSSSGSTKSRSSDSG